MNKLIEDHQNETIESLEKMRKAEWKKAQVHLDQIEIINDAIGKIQAAILMNQTKWKLDEQN